MGIPWSIGVVIQRAMTSFSEKKWKFTKWPWMLTSPFFIVCSRNNLGMLSVLADSQPISIGAFNAPPRRPQRGATTSQSIKAHQLSANTEIPSTAAGKRMLHHKANGEEGQREERGGGRVAGLLVCQQQSGKACHRPINSKVGGLQHFTVSM